MGNGMAPPASDAGIRPIEDIIVGDIAVEIDTASGSAVIRVETSIDVVCAVAYGTTPALGSLATDTDMAGGGHSDHHPVLRGLEAGVEYLYVLSGIGPDGTLYTGDVMRFTFDDGGTASPATTIDLVPTLQQPPAPDITSRARVGAVSSQFSEAFRGEYAIDDDLSTEWSSAGDGDEAFIVLEFDEQMHIAGVGFHTRSMTDGTATTTAFTVTAAGVTYGPFEARAGLSIAPLDFSAAIIRVDVHSSTGGNTGAVEIRIYGEPLAAPLSNDPDDGM